MDIYKIKYGPETMNEFGNLDDAIAQLTEDYLLNPSRLWHIEVWDEFGIWTISYEEACEGDYIGWNDHLEER